MTYAEAIRKAMAEEMRKDKKVFLMGEDVAQMGGLFKASEGLLAEFGPDRVRDTPISEAAITGAGVGAAVMGMRPIVEIQFADILVIAMDHIVQSAAKAHYIYAGKASCPLVIRAPQGIGLGFGMHHSQCVESWFMNVPGLKIVFPATPADAKGLLKAAIRDNDPVLFLEHKRLYSTSGEVSENEDQLIPLGQADVKREGTDLTVIATGMMLHYSLEVADDLADEGVSVEVVDPRTLRPLDTETILASVRKTGKVLIIHEAPKFGGFGGEVAAVIAEEAIGDLDGPVLRLAGREIPVPFASEDLVAPTREEIKAAILSLL
jgi:acetoin:2,6-dichlorophenolindophenol oxidoreductase subunit beta